MSSFEVLHPHCLSPILTASCGLQLQTLANILVHRLCQSSNTKTYLAKWPGVHFPYNLLRGELPLDKAEARRLARRAKSFVLLGDEKELYHRNPSGILQRCISVAQGQEMLQEIHSGACGHHAAPRTLVGNAFRQGFYWPTVVADATRIVRSCRGVNST
jgi:hypothetical protein